MIGDMKLEITNRILRSRRYLQLCSELRELERDRIFCGHDMEHFLSVARIAMLLCHEAGIQADPDTIYAAALLHDIGRAEEYRTGVPHDQAGAVIAGEILEEVGAPPEMQADVVRIIAAHRRPGSEIGPVEEIFYRADKKSRLCFCCKAKDLCNWPDSRRNNEIGV